MVVDVALSPLARMVETTPTDYWNDSCAVAELEYAIARGATGATSNPVIVGEVMKKEKDHWVPRVRELAAANPTWSEVEITWALIEEMGVRGAGILRPVFDAHGGRKGRLSLQTNPANYRDPARMADQAVHFATLAPNIQVKFPATAAGIAAIEEATARGVVINGTVAFTFAQAIAIAEAVERGIARFEAAGGDAVDVLAGVLADGRAARRLGEGLRRAGRHRPRSRCRQLGGPRRVQAGLRALPGARLPDAAPRRGVPPPAPLDRARGRRRRPDDAPRVAGPVQRQRHRPRPADRRAGPGGVRRRPPRPRPGLPPRVRAGRPRRRPSSIPSGRPRARCARSWRATTGSSGRSATSSCRTPTSSRPEHREYPRWPSRSNPSRRSSGTRRSPSSGPSEAEKDLFWVFDDLHCPHPLSPMFEDIGGWWLSLRPHVPPLRHAVRLRLAGEEHQRLPVHGGDPGRGRPSGRGAGVRLRDGRRRAPGSRVREPASGSTWTRSCPSTGWSSRTPGGTAWSPRWTATSRSSRGCWTAARSCPSPRSRSCSRTRSTSTTATGRSTGCSTSRS